MKSESNFLQVSDLSMILYLLAKHMLRQSKIAFISDIKLHTLWPSALLRNSTLSIFHFCKKKKEFLFILQKWKVDQALFITFAKTWPGEHL